MATGNDISNSVRYEADERPPLALSVGLGVQLMVLIVAGIVLTPAIVIRAAGGGETYLAWAVFAAVAISGTTTVMQAVRVGRIGAGYVLAMGTSGAFIAICVTALVEGGPALLATLVVISALFQFAFSARLSLFRHILTPTVAGTVIMLIAVTVMPIIFGMLTEVPEGAPAVAAPFSAVDRVEGDRCVALVGAGHRRVGRFGGCRLLRPVRHRPGCTSVMDRVPHRGLARFRSRIRRRLLVPAAGFHLRHAGRRH